MKTTIEMHGYEITISESEEGKVMVQALKDGEVIEEFELEGGEDQPGTEDREDMEEMGDEEMSAFGEEESDLGDEGEEAEEEMGEEESGEEMEEEEMGEEEGALESFSAFFNTKKMKYRKH